METVKLCWIQTRVNDPFTKDTYAIADSNFNTTEFSYVHDPEDYALPTGYRVGETNAGEIAIYDPKNNYCDLDRNNKHPRLISSAGVVYLKKSLPPLVGVSDAAKILGWSKGQVNVYISRGKFPQPIQRISSGPVWTRQQILDYKSSITPQK